MSYFHLIIGAFFSLMFAGMMLTVALSDIPAIQRDKLGAALAFIAGGLVSALPFIFAAQMFALSMK